MARKYTLRRAAVEDLKDIGTYTLENFGRSQRDKYLKGLEERFAFLGDNPQSGRSRDDVGIGYRCSAYGKHVVFYKVIGGVVEISAVLHERMVPEQKVY